MLRRQATEIDAAPVDARWSAGFQAALGQFQLFQPRRQGDRRRIASTPCGVVVEAHMHFAVQEGSGRQHHSPGFEANAHLRDNAGHSIAFNNQIIAGPLEQPQVRLVLKPTPNGCPVQHAIGLGAGRAHRGALRSIQDAELDAGLVGRRSHRAAQRIDLLDQMPFADAANRRVTTHLTQRLDVVRQQERGAAEPSRGQCRLGTGVAATDHNDVEDLGEPHGIAYFLSNLRL